MGNKNKSVSESAPTVYFNNNDIEYRKEISSDIVDSIIRDNMQYLISDRTKLSGSFMADKSEMLQFYKMLRDTYLAQIKNIEDGIQKANLTYMYLKNKGAVECNPFEEDIEEAKRAIERLRELVNPIIESIIKIENNHQE